MAEQPPTTTVCAAEDAIAIRFQRVGFRALRASLLFAVFAVILCSSFSGIGAVSLWRAQTWDAKTFLVVYLSFSLFMTVIAAGLVASALHRIDSQPEVFATAAKLTINERSRWRKKAREWRRDSVAAFDTDAWGLWVLGGARPRPVLMERTQDELRWLAQTLAERWQVPPREPPEPGDIEADALISQEGAKPADLQFGYRNAPNGVQRARVRLRDGQLIVRLAFSRQCPLRFLPYRILGRWRHLIDGSLPIDTDDVAWLESESGTCVRISPRVPGGDGYDVTIWPESATALRTMFDAFFKRG